MDKIKMLSGYEIVAKGATKIEATLPELGIKDIFPNRTWLEDKQIQAAIESRKQLIEIERIDKSGLISYAEWREDLMLAEVTQQVGSYWQYLGHNNGKNLFLRPEEALFLLEINNLCLKHNNVIVSLQQAYSLLLRDRMSLLRYKVYASLSRLGFRVFRHQMSELRFNEQTMNVDPIQIENQVNDTNKEDNHESFSELHKNSSKTLLQSVIEIPKENTTVPDKKIEIQPEACATDVVETMKTEEKTVMTIELHSSANTEEQSSNNNYPSCSQIKQGNIYAQKKLQNLKCRQLIPCKSKIVRQYFEKVPEFLGKQIITVKAPDKQLLPKNVVLKHESYKINLQNIQNKSIRHSSTEVNVYNANEEVNGSHIRRLRNVSNRTESNWNPPTGNVRFVNQNIYFRPFHYWRPRQPFNYHNINMYQFQRGFIPSLFFNQNFNVFPRPQPVFCRPNFNNNFRNIYNEHNRKIMKKTVQKKYLEGILKLADQLKQLIINGDTHQRNINALQILIQSYNTKYKTKLTLNERFDLVIDETITDTIELDDDDEGPSTKKRRINDCEFEDNLNNLKLFAQRLKGLECNDKSSGRHRRAFSKLIKTFNKSYNEDYYLNEEYEVVYRNQIDLDTSESDLECNINPPNVSGKKLRNPFNIMKRFSENHNVELVNASSSESSKKIITPKKYSPMLLKTFTKDWLPGEDDFGRAEIFSDADLNNVTDIKKEEFLYDFIKIQTHRYDNWLELKKSFYKSIQAAISEFQNSMPSTDNVEMNSMVKPEDCANMASVLKKLSIIKTYKETKDNSNLAVDFDVYARDVQNFRKTNRPKPHFRLMCIEESTDIPSGDEIAALHAKYKDGVNIVFAIVSIDSISYIQINPTDLPMYISS